VTRNSTHRFSRLAALLAGALALSFAAPSSAGEVRKADVEAILGAAASYYKANGKAKLVEAVANKDPKFVKGELYIVVYDMNAVILAHPFNPKLVGKDLLNVPDVDGKAFRKEFVEVAKTKGAGWVDYKYRNPETGKVEPKTSKVLKVSDDCFLMAGMYRQ
jgi:cytochrome c